MQAVDAALEDPAERRVLAHARLALLKRKEEERDQLRKRCATSEIAQRRAEITPTRLREALAARFADWRSVVQRHPAQARQI